MPDFPPRLIIGNALTYCPLCDEEGDLDDELAHADLILGALAGSGWMIVRRPVQARAEDGDEDDLS